MKLYAWFLFIGLVSPAFAGDQISSDCADQIIRNRIDPDNQQPIECGGGDGRRGPGLISNPKPRSERIQSAHNAFKAMNRMPYWCPSGCK